MTTIASAATATLDSIETLRFADAEEHTISLDALGVLYLVDFWALGCKRCILEMPELERLAKDYEPGGRFRFVGVVWGGWKGKDLWTVAERANTKLPVYSDPENWFQRLGIEGYPTKIMIRDGKVLRRARGGGAGAYATRKKAIDDQPRSSPAASQP